MFKQIMGLFTALAVASTPIAALAQQAEASSMQRAVQIVPLTEEMTVQKVEIAPGLFLPPNEAVLLARYGCVVGPTVSLTAELYDWAERKGVNPCEKKFNTKVDEFIGKESTQAYRVMDGADGYEYCVTMKVANLGNNRESCRTYVPVDRLVVNGQPGKFGDVNWATGGGTMKAQAMISLGGALIQGPLTAATGQLLAPGCNNCGGPSVVNLVEANAAAVQSTMVETRLQAALGGCGVTTCPTTAPPAHTTQPNPGY